MGGSHAKGATDLAVAPVLSPKSKRPLNVHLDRRATKTSTAGASSVETSHGARAEDRLLQFGDGRVSPITSDRGRVTRLRDHEGPRPSATKSPTIIIAAQAADAADRSSTACGRR